MTARRSVDSGRCASSSLGRSLVLADGSSTEARTIDPREYRRHPPPHYPLRRELDRQTDIVLGLFSFYLGKTNARPGITFFGGEEET